MSNDLTDLILQFRNEAEELEGIDREVYAQYNRDPLTPIIGMGNPRCDICIFGRDPGRQEVEFQVPFIGAGGQKVRRELYQCLHGTEMPDFEASREIGKTVFWANTVPYKPIGNKAWSERVKKKFKPLMARVLLDHWHGSRIITLGREAFFWFGIGEDKPFRAELKAFWESTNRFETSFSINFQKQRTLELFPLPHPSPLNATWYHRFPSLLKNRLLQTSFVESVKE